MTQERFDEVLKILEWQDEYPLVQIKKNVAVGIILPGIIDDIIDEDEEEDFKEMYIDYANNNIDMFK